MNTSPDPADAERPDNDADSLLAEWICEAGDSSMTPRTEHVAQLKEQLLRRSQPAAGTEPVRSQPSPAKERPRRGWVWAALASAAALLVLSLYPGNDRENAAWAQVREAVNAMPWMRCRQHQEDGSVMEAWYSPMRLVAAARAVPPPDADVPEGSPFAVFIDIRQSTRFEYRPQDDQIVKWPMLETDGTSMRVMAGILSAFGNGKDFESLAAEMPELKIVGEREVEIDGRTLKEFDVESTLAGREMKSTYRVDAATKLPVSSTTEINGESIETDIDFPKTGPESIYDLGVDRDVAVVDRMPAPELSRLLDRRQQVRMEFDRYYGMAVQVDPENHWSNAVRVTRIWRNGLKWRTEYMIYDVADSKRIRGREVPPDGTDPREWWFAQVAAERFRPTTLSDGTHTWRFEFDAEQSKTDPQRWDYTVKPATKNPYPINPQNPLPTVVEFPEFMVYAPTGLPSPKRIGKLTLEPEEGPEGTVMVESRTTDEPRPQGNDLSYYWVDPLENGMTRRWQVFSLTGDEPKLLGERTVLETARTPRGYLYPTRYQSDSGVVTHFYLDFDAEFDDAVFDPALTDKAPEPR